MRVHTLTFSPRRKSDKSTAERNQHQGVASEKHTSVVQIVVVGIEFLIQTKCSLAFVYIFKYPFKIHFAFAESFRVKPFRSYREV